MSPEKYFLEKLQNRYGGTPQESNPTPCQALSIIGKQKLIIGLAEQTGISDFNFLERAFHPNGRFLSVKFRVFSESLKDLKGSGEGERLLPFLDTKCLYEKGGISIRRLRQLRKRRLKQNGEN